MQAISELNDLREAVKARMGEWRFAHTLAVEREIVKLGEIYLPQNIYRLQIAALLHDLTKELSAEAQIAFCEQHGIPLSEEERATSKTLHAKTGAYLAAREFPHLVDEEILDAIDKHTTGGERMSLFAKLLYLADYIEDTRTFSDCVRLRNMFWNGFDDLPQNKRAEHLDRVLLASFDMTIKALRTEGSPISSATLLAREALLADINKYI